jgi:hypothetical protein
MSAGLRLLIERAGLAAVLAAILTEFVFVEMTVWRTA